MPAKKVLIIGAGIGGLASANLLAKAGYDVEVFEKNTAPGGRAGVLESDGFRFDTGPSWYLMPEVFEHYYQLLDENITDHLELMRLSPAYKVFFEDSDPLVVTSDLSTDKETFERIQPGAGAALERYVRRGETIYQLALRHFLYTNFSSVRDLLHPEVLSHAASMLRLVTTPIHRYVARFVSDQRLQQILEYPMVFLGSSPFKAPAIYSLMSALDFRSGVFYPSGGLYTIIESLYTIGKNYGVTYHFDAPVEEIIISGTAATGIRLSNGKVITADIVISNADLHHTETKLLPAQHRTYDENYWSKRQPGPSALLLYLGIKGSLPMLDHHNLLFVSAWQENFTAIYDTKTMPNPASIYLCKPSTTDETVAPDGYENLFVLVPLPAGVDLSATEQEEWADRYIEQTAKLIDAPDIRDRIVFRKSFGPGDFTDTFNAWQSTALGVSHILKQSAFFRTNNKSKKVKNLYYIGGNTRPGIGLPMCLISAELLYKRLAGDIRGGPIAKISPLDKETSA